MAFLAARKSWAAGAAKGREPESRSLPYRRNLPPQSAARFARMSRNPWGGCESRNHWVRDAPFGEDATRSKNLHLDGNLAVLRCAVIDLKMIRLMKEELDAGTVLMEQRAQAEFQRLEKGAQDTVARGWLEAALNRLDKRGQGVRLKKA